MAAEAILIGSTYFAPGLPVPLPADTVHAGTGVFRGKSVHKYYHHDSGSWYLLAPENGGWRLYEFGSGDCPCTDGFNRV